MALRALLRSAAARSPRPPTPLPLVARPKSTPMTSDTTGHLDLRLTVVFHDAFRRDLAHLPRAASRRPVELNELTRRTAVVAGWELFKTQLHHHTALEAP
jgi:hypothetical protein